MKSELKIETRVRSLKNYIDEFENGVFQIPTFQRDFLWSSDDIKQLFDSIKNSYPIGSIQFWQPLENANDWIGERPIGPYTILRQETQNPIFILDGYQRLSSLFGCLVNPEKFNKEKLKFDEELWKEKFNIFYDLEDQEFITLRKGGKNKTYQIPVYLLLSASDFRKYAREIIEKIEDKNKIDIYLDRADQLADIFNNYQIASVDIKYATIGEAVEIFWRVNAKGLEISKDWIVNALTNKNGFRLQTELDLLIENLELYNFNKIKRDLLFNCIQSSFGKLYYDTNIETLIKDPIFNFIKTAEKTISSIPKAVKFMFENLHIVHHKLLPSNWQFIFIVEFFNIIPVPTDDEIKELEEWFWFTAYSNYFTIYNPSKRSKAFIQFRSYLLMIENELIYNDEPLLGFSSPKYRYSHFGSVRFTTNVLFQLKPFKISAENCLGFETIKLYKEKPESLENMVYLPIFIKDNIFTLNNKKHKDLSFLLNSEYRGQFSELFITDDMRDAYSDLDDDEVLKLRYKLIVEKERYFVKEVLGIDYIK